MGVVGTLTCRWGGAHEAPHPAAGRSWWVPRLLGKSGENRIHDPPAPQDTNLPLASILEPSIVALLAPMNTPLTNRFPSAGVKNQTLREFVTMFFPSSLVEGKPLSGLTSFFTSNGTKNHRKRQTKV